jgi:hypothetical protein
VRGAESEAQESPATGGGSPNPRHFSARETQRVRCKAPKSLLALAPPGGEATLAPSFGLREYEVRGAAARVSPSPSARLALSFVQLFRPRGR